MLLKQQQLLQLIKLFNHDSFSIQSKLTCSLGKMTNKIKGKVLSKKAPAVDTTFQQYHQPAQQGTTRTYSKQLSLKYLAVQEIFIHTVNNICQSDGKKETIDTVLKGENHNTWEKGLSIE